MPILYRYIKGWSGCYWRRLKEIGLVLANRRAGENREEYTTKCEEKEEGSKLMGSYSSDVSVHLCGVWRVLCMSNIDKTLVNFLFQVNSKTAFQVNFWLMGLYLPARLHTSLDLREAACRFTANKVFSPQGNPEFSFQKKRAKACSKTKERFIPLQTCDPLLHPLKTFHPPSQGSVLRPS